MSSKFSNILAQARNRQNDSGEISPAGENNESSKQTSDTPEISATGSPSSPPETATGNSLPQTEPQKRTGENEASHKSNQIATPIPHEAAIAVAPEPTRGRPRGKRSDPDFTQITAYITKATHAKIKMALLEAGEGREMSEVIEECLVAWLNNR